MHEMTQTGVSELDSLLSKYGFEISGFYIPDSVGYFETKQFLNIPPLLDSLTKFEGVIEADFMYSYGDGDKLYYQKINDLQQFTFIRAWGDCKLGCYCDITWKFNVDNSYNATFEEKSLRINPLWPFTKSLQRHCNITMSTGIHNNTEGINVVDIKYDQLSNNLTIEANQSGRYYVSIFDLTGRMMLSNSFQYETVVQTGGFKSGIYLVYVHDFNSNTTNTIKILKE
jgi:hypothetical protein